MLNTVTVNKKYSVGRPQKIDLGCASVKRNTWGGDPESLWANRSVYYPRDQSLFVLLYHNVTQRKNDSINWKLISTTMVLITKNTCLNDHKFFLRIIIMKS